MRERRAVPRLLRETGDRRRAIDALATIGDPQTFQVLREALIDDRLPSATRARCAGALGHEATDRLYLHVAAKDEARSVRNAARVALLRLGETQKEATRRRAALRC